MLHSTLNINNYFSSFPCQHDYLNCTKHLAREGSLVLPLLNYVKHTLYAGLWANEAQRRWSTMSKLTTLHAQWFTVLIRRNPYWLINLLNSHSQSQMRVVVLGNGFFMPRQSCGLCDDGHPNMVIVISLLWKARACNGLLQRGKMIKSMSVHHNRIHHYISVSCCTANWVGKEWHDWWTAKELLRA